jgi:hypothetical protein
MKGSTMPLRQLFQLFFLATLMVGISLSGCQSAVEDDAGNTVGDAGVGGDDSSGFVDIPSDLLKPGQICVPNIDVKACVIEGGKLAMICNNSGTGYVERVCPGVDPNGSQTVDAQCRTSEDGKSACTTCFPGDRSCLGESKVMECAADGSEWNINADCENDQPGTVCTGQVCEKLCDVNVKFNSYIGCDYWGVDLDNAFVPGGKEGYYDASGAQFAIAVSNPPDSPLTAVVKVFHKNIGDASEQEVPYDVEGNPMEPVELKPGDLHVFRLPRRDVNGTTLAPLAYRVESDVPIIAYQFNPMENENVFSNDASLLLPSALLGRDYVVMTREQTFEILRGFITVVAVMEGETTVSVEVADGPTLAGYKYPDAPNEEEIPIMYAGDTRMFKLQQYDVLNIETNRPGADLTGTRVLSDQRVAVFGGSEAANAPNDARCIDIDPETHKGVCEYDGVTTCTDLLDCVAAGFNTCCADHLEQQMFPVKTWGTSYVATKSWDRGKESDIWRIIAAEDNTTVVLVPPPVASLNVPVLNRGEWFEFESRKHFEIHSTDEDKPILVGQFLAAQDAPNPNVGGQAQADDAGTGDPAFILSVPVQQYRTDYVVFTPAEYEDNYVNITIPAGASLTIDGDVIPPGYFEIIGSGLYSVYRQRFKNSGPHVISSSEPVGAIVYGYDQYVSYGYTGGLDLEEINSENPFTAP